MVGPHRSLCGFLVRVDPQSWGERLCDLWPFIHQRRFLSSSSLQAVRQLLARCCWRVVIRRLGAIFLGDWWPVSSLKLPPPPQVFWIMSPKTDLRRDWYLPNTCVWAIRQEDIIYIFYSTATAIHLGHLSTSSTEQRTKFRSLWLPTNTKRGIWRVVVVAGGPSSPFCQTIDEMTALFKLHDSPSRVICLRYGQHDDTTARDCG